MKHRSTLDSASTPSVDRSGFPLTGMIQAGESSDWPTPPMYFEKKDLQLRNIE